MTLETIVSVFRALGDPTRLGIVRALLGGGERCVSDLQNILELPQPLLSRHLAYLRHAGLATNRRDGQRVFYSLVLEDPGLERFLRELFSRGGGARRETGRFHRAPASTRPAVARPKAARGARR